MAKAGKNGKNGKKTSTVLAAGAVLFRDGNPGREVAVVHRDQYDDWSLPKGKVDAGESLPVTAVRELEEETGYRSRLTFRLGTTAYPLKEKVRKEVTYWAAEVLGGGFIENGEVDELRWLSVADACDTVSYSLDRKLLEKFDERPEITHSLLLVRHAKAGNRADWKGDDAERPIDKTGRAQSEMLTPLLASFGVRGVHAAPLVRCEQTLTPLADELGVEIVGEPALSDRGFADDPVAAVTRLTELAGSSDGPVAVCSQGGAIPGMVSELAGKAGLDVGDAATKKGGTWFLGFHGSRLVAADLIQDPLPVK